MTEQLRCCPRQELVSIKLEVVPFPVRILVVLQDGCEPLLDPSETHETSSSYLCFHQAVGETLSDLKTFVTCAPESTTSPNSVRANWFPAALPPPPPRSVSNRTMNRM